MRVFRLTQDHRYSGLAFAREEDAWLFDRFDGSPMASSWPVVSVVPSDEEPLEVERSDFWTLGTIPVFSERAVRICQEVLTQHGELLPLNAEWGTIHALNVTVVRDALDEAGSALTRFSSGEVMNISRFEFRSELISDVELFKIPQKPRAFVMTTELFVARVREAALLGFDFKELWTDEDNA